MHRIYLPAIFVLIGCWGGWTAGLAGDSGLCWYSMLFPPRMEDGIYPRHYRPERTVDMQHIRLQIRVDLKERKIDGIVQLQVSPFHEDIDSIRLDSAGLTIEEILLDRAQPLTYDLVAKENELIVLLPDGTGARDQFTLSIRYRGSPKRHFYWRNTKDPYAEEADMAFTLGEPRGASYWFPCLDYPSDRLTTEIIAVVPKGFVTISNGALLSKKISPDGRWETHHWSQKLPHVTYLMSLVVGRYGVVRGEWRGIPVEYYCMPGKEADAEASMGMTPEMLEFYSDLFGVDYPYEKYAQVPVKDFPAGGMEHTTCTTMHEFIVLDKRARIDHDEEWLIAHELVHQWFGDLLTCESWPHLWLNEGFASYFAPAWFEHRHGKDEFLRLMLDSAESYFNEAERYTRPVVTNKFASAGEMFDRHSYPKGAWVLHMLRSQLGDKLFYQAIRHYCRKHQNSLVDTDDFQEAVEEATGRPFDRFFEQWVYRAGHPKLKVEWSWLADQKQVKLAVKQIQKMEEGAQPFFFPLHVRVVTGDETIDLTFSIDQKEETFFISCDRPPKSVDVDPELTQLIELDFEKSNEMLMYDAEHGKSVITRVRAIRKLAGKDEAECIDTLARVVNNDPFWWVQAEAAKALGSIETKETVDETLNAVSHPDPRVRRAVAEALGNFLKETRVLHPLKELLERDESLYVAAQAAESLGRVDLPQSLRILSRNVKQESFADRVRIGVLNAMAELENEKALPILYKYTHVSQNERVRTAAIRGIGRIAKLLDEKKQVDPLKRLLKYLEDDSDRIRRAAVDGLADLGNPRAIKNLRIHSKHDPSPRVQESARRAIDRIRSIQLDLAKKNAGRIDELVEKQKKLEKTIEELRRKLELKEKKTETIEKKSE